MTQKRPHDRSRAGFTMMELMGAVAIIAIVMAVAFPAAASIQANLRVMELNAKAQQVYNQAQSRLTSLQTDGTLSDLESKLGSGTSRQLASAPVAPAAYTYGDGLTNEWSKYGMYQLSSTVAADKTIISDYLITSDTSLGASAGLTGNYVIELSPSTGEVYAVYYWEGDASGSGSITYDTVASQTTDQLKANHIGYYGGKPIDPAITHKSVALFDDLGFSIVNDEELYVRIFSSDISKSVFDPSKLTVNVSVSGPSTLLAGSYTRSLTFQGGSSQSGFSVNAATDEVDVILDSMRSGLSFRDIMGSTIIPGTNVSVSVSVTYNGTTYDASNRTGMQDKSTNSLFGSYDETAKTIQVSAVRHLNNMSSSWLNLYNLYWAYWYSAQGYTKVSQTDDIDFDGNDWSTTPTCVSIQSRSDQSANGWNPLTQFSPIDNGYYNRNWGGRTFDGMSHKIENFVIVGTGSDTGLFPYSYLDFANVYLTNETVTGPGLYTGGLTGEFLGGSLSNCHNDVTKTDANGDLLLANYGVTGYYSYVGGLVGYYGNGSVTITGCSATTNVTSTNGGYAGGLIGYLGAGGSTVSACTVGSETGIVTISGSGSWVGGMLGKHDGSSISNCTAFANVSSNDGYVGGVVGYMKDGGSSISGCRVGSESAPVTITSRKTGLVGGIVGEHNGSGGISDCSAFANITSTAGDCIGGVVGYSYSGGAKITNCSAGSEGSPVTIITAGSSVGGLVGQHNGSSIDGCKAYVTSVTSTNGNHVGGLIGDVNVAGVTVTNCFVGSGNAPAAVSASGDCVGGLIGQHDGSNIDGCDAYATSIVSTGGSYAGGLVGQTTSTGIEITNCHASSGIDGPTRDQAEVVAAAKGGWVGGLIGSTSAKTVDGCSALANVTGSNSGSCVGGLIGNLENSSASVSNCTAGVGVGTLSKNGACVASGGSYVGGLVGWIKGASASVSNCQAFENVTAYGNYVGGLVGEMYPSGSASITSCSVGEGATSGANALVISSSTGSYLGGLVGQFYGTSLASDSAVANVTTTGGMYVGGLCGRTLGNNVVVDSCSAGSGGSVILSVSGDWFTGGLIGRVQGSWSTVQNCSATCVNVSSTRTSVGGLLGEINNGTVTNCHVVGNPDYDNSGSGRPVVSGKGYVGGFAGRLGANAVCNVSGCYSDADAISAGSFAGGFAGYTEKGSITSCYASGQAVGTTYLGGFAGVAYYMTFSNCFTTSDIWGTNSSDGRVGGFVGSIEHSQTFSNDISYGRVRDTAGNVPASASRMGGFVGYNSGRSDANNLPGCTYLLMTGYNQNISNTTTAAYQPAGSSYGALQVSGNDASLTHAYQVSLKGKAFPFAYASYDGSTMPYYGDWPLATYHITFVDHNGTKILETDVDPGSTPAAPSNPSGVTAMAKSYFGTDNRLYAWTGKWIPSGSTTAGLVAATGDTTYTAEYKAIDVPNLIAGGTAYSGATLFSTYISSAYNNNANAVNKTVVINNSTKFTADVVKSNRTMGIDSEGPFSSGANCNTTIRNQLVNTFGYLQGITDNTTGSFSWRIQLNSNVVSVVADANYKKYVGYDTSGKTSTGGYTVLLGEKIPNWDSITTAQKTARYQVIQYDVGRASIGLAPYRLGTAGIKTPGSQYSYYVYTDFQATTDYFSL
ncbi:MAG: type II secretion system protein [Atopobiaceae bacterium]